MTTRWRRLFGSPTQNNNETEGGSPDLSTRDTPTILKVFGYNNRNLQANGSTSQPNPHYANDDLTQDPDNNTLRPRSSGEFSLMLSEQTSMDRRSSFLTSYYGSSASPSIAHVQRSFAFAPSFGGQSLFQTSEALLARPVSPRFQPHSTDTSSVPSGNQFQNVRRLPTIEEGRLSVSIDFGMSYSRVAFGSSRVAGGQVRQILQWPGSFENFRKIPTCLLYHEDGKLLTWGLEAKAVFKLFLEPKFLRDGVVDSRLPQLPPGKPPIEAMIDFLSCLWNYAKQQITREVGAVADLDTAEVWLIVPATWDVRGCDIMREAAVQAGLVTRSGLGVPDRNRGRPNTITEAEAATVHCAHLTNLRQLRPSQNFMIFDAGRETVDLTIYKILGNLERLEIAEVCTRSGQNCGSLSLDLRFRDLVLRMLESHPAHTSPASLAYFQGLFSENDKLVFRGEEDDCTPFQFNCFNLEDQDDPAVGLINGELTIPGALLRTEVFDPIISKILHFIEEALCSHHINALMLVGGFSENEYLFKCMNRQFGTRIGIIARPTDADTAACRGAARYGITNRVLVSSIIVPKTYIMETTLPAEQEDWQKRPAYINISHKGFPFCKNRFCYLARKGDILRKGQRVQATFCQFSRSSNDSAFTMVLHSSDSEHIMRYTDEDGAAELRTICKWTVDLAGLPGFQENVRTGSQSGFYTEFEIGLEIDSAEVRGVLLYNGDEWGRAVLEYLS